jgi:acetyltransferase
MRYFASLSLCMRTAHDRLSRICHPDPDREIVLVAERLIPQSKQTEIVGVGRLVRLKLANHAELAVVISDKSQREGLGTRLVQALIHQAQQAKIDRIVAEMLRDNFGMQIVLKRAGFCVYGLSNPSSVKAYLDLTDSPNSALCDANHIQS